MPTATLNPLSPPAAKAARTTPIRVAIVGCGAVTKSNLLPVIAGHEQISLMALVDRDAARAQGLADSYGVSRILTDLAALDAKDVDAVVLATPPAHHAPATIDLTSRGIHVFVEKPMAIRTADAEAMAASADKAGVVLSVGLYRRMLPGVKLLRRMIDSGEFGRPLSADIEEGGPYGWNLATLDVLTSAAGGGGCLIDIGSHVIDLILYALPGAATLTSYEDNVRGGIETDCVARFSIAHAAGAVPVRLELSRTRELRGSIRVECEQATLELLRGNFLQVLVHPRGQASRAASAQGDGIKFTAEWEKQPPFIGYDAFRAQFDDFLGAIVNHGTPELSGRSVVPVVRLIEECYTHRTPLVEPWTDEGMQGADHAAPPAGARRKKVLVTGAGGFLGGRAVELLTYRYGYEVVAMVKEPRSAARLARWPIAITLGDVCSAADMERALKGCDAVVHCAVGTSWDPAETARVTIEGTRTVAEAAQKAGVKRLVHISTMNVHSQDVEKVLDESTPCQPAESETYGKNKLLAEQAVIKASAQGLTSIILRPARIYGPFSKTFTVRPLQALTEGRLAISGNPDVPANMVYVDNVVGGIARALEAPDSLNTSAYLINDPVQPSLKKFFEYFAAPAKLTLRLSGPRPAASGTRKKGWIGGLRTIALSPEVRALVHRVMDTEPVGNLPKWLWNSSPNMQRKLLKLFKVDAAVIYRPAKAGSVAELPYYGGPAVVSGAKAEKELSFVPPVSHERAMTLTLMWAEHARLLPRVTTK